MSSFSRKVNPAGKVVSKIAAKFTVINDPRNKNTAREIAALQKKITSSEEKRIMLKKKLEALDRKRARQTTKNLRAEIKGHNAILRMRRKELEALKEQEIVSAKMYEKNLANMAAYSFALAGIGKIVTTGLKLNIEYIEDLNIINRLFGENTDKIVAWSKTTRNSFGLAQTSALKYVSTLKTFLTSAGINDQLSTIGSVVGVQLAADLSSFRNVSFDTSFRAIVSGLAGITRTLRYNFGVDIGENALKERFGSDYGSTQSERIIQRFQLLLEKTNFVVGDFARTKNSPANQLRLLNENFKQFSFLISKSLLPIVNMMLIVMNSMLEILIRVQNLLVWIGGTLAIAKLTQGIFRKAGLASILTFGLAPEASLIKKLFFGIGGGLLIAGLVGKLFPHFSEGTVSKPQDGTSYLPDNFNIDDYKGTNDNSININVQGNMTGDSVSELVFQMKKERFNT